MDTEQLKKIIEAALLATAEPLTVAQLDALFDDDEKPGNAALKQALAALDHDLADRAVALVEVASGYRIQVRPSVMPRLAKLWTDKPPKYSRALLETLAIIAYRQPITRGEIEQIRGVSLSSTILRTLQEREWIKIIGHRDVPGRPELLGTTREFLDYFNLKSLNELPTLAEIKDLESFEPELNLSDPEHEPAPEPATTANASVDTEPGNDDPNDAEDRGDEAGTENATAEAIDHDADDTESPHASRH